MEWILQHVIRLLSSTIIPRPIAFVSSLNRDGSLNAAPFSSFMIASVEAGLLLPFSVGPGQLPKGTLQNGSHNREYVINTVPIQLVRNPGTSKVAVASLHGIASKKIRTPRIAETRVQFECALNTILPFGERHMVVGRVLIMHVREGLAQDGKIDLHEYTPLGRIAGRNYCAVTDLISV